MYVAHESPWILVLDDGRNVRGVTAGHTKQGQTTFFEFVVFTQICKGTTSLATAGSQAGIGPGPPDRSWADPICRPAGTRLIPKNDPSWIPLQAGFQP
jgi:hypothetical protein